MKRSLLSALFIFGAILCQSQEVCTTNQDSLNLLTGSNWVTAQGWFGDSAVILLPVPRANVFDTAGMSTRKKQKALIEWHKNTVWFETISFDKTGRLNYAYALPCPVGETLRDVKKMKFMGPRINVVASKYEWNKDPVYQTWYYEIVQWSEAEIKLRIIKRE